MTTSRKTEITKATLAMGRAHGISDEQTIREQRAWDMAHVAEEKRAFAALAEESRKERAMTAKSEAAALLEQIAREHLDLDTLKTRDSDSLDFHSLSVWQIRAALEAAYQAGAARKA